MNNKMNDEEINKIAQAIAAKIAEPGGNKLLGCGSASSTQRYQCSTAYQCNSGYECGGAAEFYCYNGHRCGNGFYCYTNFTCQTSGGGFSCNLHYNS